MHEWSFARSLLQQASGIAREQGGARLLEVQVSIGPLSGVEASLLESAFEQLACDEGLASTRLVVETTPLVVRCRDCDSESSLSEFVFRCPACQSPAVRVVRGDQLQLVSVTVDDEPAAVDVSRRE